MTQLSQKAASMAIGAILKKQYDSFIESVKLENIDITKFTSFPVRIYYSWINTKPSILLINGDQVIIDAKPSTKVNTDRIAHLSIKDFVEVRKASFWDKFNVNNIDFMFVVKLEKDKNPVRMFVELPGQPQAACDKEKNEKLVQLLKHTPTI